MKIFGTTSNTCLLYNACLFSPKPRTIFKAPPLSAYVVPNIRKNNKHKEECVNPCSIKFKELKQEIKLRDCKCDIVDNKKLKQQQDEIEEKFREIEEIKQELYELKEQPGCSTCEPPPKYDCQQNARQRGSGNDCICCKDGCINLCKCSQSKNGKRNKTGKPDNNRRKEKEQKPKNGARNQIQEQNEETAIEPTYKTCYCNCASEATWAAKIKKPWCQKFTQFSFNKYVAFIGITTRPEGLTDEQFVKQLQGQDETKKEKKTAKTMKTNECTEVEVCLRIESKMACVCGGEDENNSDYCDDKNCKTPLVDQYSSSESEEKPEKKSKKKSKSRDGGCSNSKKSKGSNCNKPQYKKRKLCQKVKKGKSKPCNSCGSCDNNESSSSDSSSNSSKKSRKRSKSKSSKKNSSKRSRDNKKSEKRVISSSCTVCSNKSNKNKSDKRSDNKRRNSGENRSKDSKKSENLVCRRKSSKNKSDKRSDDKRFQYSNEKSENGSDTSVCSNSCRRNSKTCNEKDNCKSEPKKAKTEKRSRSSSKSEEGKQQKSDEKERKRYEKEQKDKIKNEKKKEKERKKEYKKQKEKEKKDAIEEYEQREERRGQKDKYEKTCKCAQEKKSESSAKTQSKSSVNKDSKSKKTNKSNEKKNRKKEQEEKDKKKKQSTFASNTSADSNVNNSSKNSSKTSQKSSKSKQNSSSREENKRNPRVKYCNSSKNRVCMNNAEKNKYVTCPGNKKSKTACYYHFYDNVNANENQKESNNMMNNFVLPNNFQNSTIGNVKSSQPEIPEFIGKNTIDFHTFENFLWKSDSFYSSNSSLSIRIDLEVNTVEVSCGTDSWLEPPEKCIPENSSKITKSTFSQTCEIPSPVKLPEESFSSVLSLYMQHKIQKQEEKKNKARVKNYKDKSSGKDIKISYETEIQNLGKINVADEICQEKTKATKAHRHHHPVENNVINNKENVELTSNKFPEIKEQLTKNKIERPSFDAKELFNSKTSENSKSITQKMLTKWDKIQSFLQSQRPRKKIIEPPYSCPASNVCVGVDTGCLNNFTNQQCSKKEKPVKQLKEPARGRNLYYDQTLQSVERLEKLLKKKISERVEFCEENKLCSSVKIMGYPANSAVRHSKREELNNSSNTSSINNHYRNVINEKTKKFVVSEESSYEIDLPSGYKNGEIHRSPGNTYCNIHSLRDAETMRSYLEAREISILNRKPTVNNECVCFTR